MKIVYRPHLSRRLKERKVPNNYPGKVYKESKAHFLDTETNHNIAFSEMEYAEKLRPMVIAYDIIDEEIYIITIHPTSKAEISKRLNSGRWIKR